MEGGQTQYIGVRIVNCEPPQLLLLAERDCSYLEGIEQAEGQFIWSREDCFVGMKAVSDVTMKT
jgi:hypothetical protein